MAVKRKGIENALMMLMPFIVGMTAMTTMIAVPQQLNQRIAQDAFSTRTLSHSHSLGEQVDNQYMVDAVNWSIYHTSFTMAADAGGTTIWSDGYVPDEDEIETNLKTQMAEDFIQNYFRGSSEQSMCTVMPGGVTFDVPPGGRVETVGGTEGVQFEIDAFPPPKVNCTALTGNATRYLPLQPEKFSINNRYFRLFRNASEIAESDWFRGVMDKIATNSSLNATLKSCVESASSECSFSIPDISDDFADNHELENEQEDLAITELQDVLEDLGDAHEEKGIWINFTIDELEFKPYNINEISDNTGGTRTGCAQSDSDSFDDTADCDDCGDCETCDVTCDGSCSLSNPGGTSQCSASNDCPSAPSWASSSLPSAPGGPDLWTESPWSASTLDTDQCSGSWSGHDDPRSISEPIPWNDGSIAYPITRAMNPRTSSAPLFTPVGGHGGTCPEPKPSCGSCNTGWCYEHLYPKTQARDSYSFDLKAYTRVTITVTDRTYKVPTADGMQHMKFIAQYEALSQNTG